MATILIGIDDTDDAASRGTGRLARMLSAECARRGLRPLGVTRHQFLVDPRIPYTSHNSGACVAVAASNGADSVAFAMDYVAERSARGSDPGVCIVAAAAVPAEIVEFARRAASQLVEMGEALGLAERAGVPLRALGGDGLGVIGALASAALRAEGNDGRFIDLPGLRDLPGVVGAEDLGRLGMRLDHRGERGPVAGDRYETLGWVRPRLIAGRPVLPVQWDEDRNAWIPADRKRSHPMA